MCNLTFVFNCDKNVYVVSQNIILNAVECLYSQSDSVDIQGRKKTNFSCTQVILRIVQYDVLQHSACIRLLNLLTPWSRVLLEKLASLQLVKKFRLLNIYTHTHTHTRVCGITILGITHICVCVCVCRITILGIEAAAAVPNN